MITNFQQVIHINPHKKCVYRSNIFNDSRDKYSKVPDIVSGEKISKTIFIGIYLTTYRRYPFCGAFAGYNGSFFLKKTLTRLFMEFYGYCKIENVSLRVYITQFKKSKLKITNILKIYRSNSMKYFKIYHLHLLIAWKVVIHYIILNKVFCIPGISPQTDSSIALF